MENLNQKTVETPDLESFEKTAKRAPKKAPGAKKVTEDPQRFEEKYYRVLFLDKSSPNDTDDVELSVNAETLVIQRGVEVIIPERFKVCADNATYQQFKQIPGKPRKLRGTIKVYPYQLIGPATKDEFFAMKRKGDKQTKDFIKKFGYDGNPDD